MHTRTSVSLCLIVLFLLGFMGLSPEVTQAASLREKMIAEAKKEGKFVIGGSNADTFRDKLKGFRKLYPFLTVKAFAANTSTTVNRIAAESKAGRLSIDLAAASSSGLALLAKMNLLEKREYPHLKDFQPGMQPSNGLYVQAFLNPRAQGVYNTNLVSPSELPRSWEDMLDTKWTGKTMISRSSEEVPALLAALWSKGGKLDWERSFDLFKGLMKQKPYIARGYRGGTTRIAAGEAAIFWFTATGPAARISFRGAPLGLIAFPKFPGGFRSFGITKGASHPAASWLFIDYLTSPQGQMEYTDVISAKVPINKKAKAGKLGKWLVEQNATVENTVALDSDVVFDKKVQKKSEEFFLRLIGVL